MSERQHSIDLMPASIRARGQAGLRIGQFTAFAVISMTATIAVATHSKIALSTAQERLFDASSKAEQVFATEAREAELRHELDAIQGFTRLYERLAFPLSVSDVLATVVNSLPESVTLDQIDLDAGSRVIGRTPRSRGVEKNSTDDTSPRMLTAEVSGFAENDQQIAELVNRLEAMQPFEGVSLDFSRGRRVNDRDAREFRLSFRISLDNTYRVTHLEEGARPAPSPDAAAREARKEVADADH
jgi:hypothetical protein